LPPAHVSAGGWTQKKGASYVKLSLNNFSTREQFNLSGKREPLNTQFSLREAKFTDNNLSFYGEYGVTDELTLVGNTSIKSCNASGFNSIDQQRYDNTISGLGDVYAGARIRLLALPLKRKSTDGSQPNPLRTTCAQSNPIKMFCSSIKTSRACGAGLFIEFRR
jgi:hypothetical protein